MSCTNPMRGFDTGYLTDNGKPLYKICSREIDFIFKPRSPDFVYSNNPRHQYTDMVIRRFIEIPCGKCKECRLAYSRQWAVRCMLEAKKYEHNAMITLTYDDEHAHVSRGIDTETGEVREVYTLKKKDVQDFLKRLRKAFANGSYTAKDGRSWKFEPNDCIRYYMCGEYGEKRKRPHYHLLMFNIKIPDQTFSHNNKKGNRQDTSELIEAIWGRGLITINEVNFETCAYVARYIMKKQKGPNAKEFYEAEGLVPEYVAMSRRPGLAFEHFKEHMGVIYETDEMFIQTAKGIQKVKPPRYYDSLYDIEDHEHMVEIKEQRRRVAEIAHKNVMNNTSLTEEEYLKVREENKEVSIKALKRIL